MLVLCTESLDPLVEVECYPIGVIRMIDDDEIDDKIIALPFGDPTWNFYHDIGQLPPHYASEITHFFEVDKGLEHKHTTTSAALTREEAVKVIEDCMQRYEVHFCGRRPEKEIAEAKAEGAE